MITKEIKQTWALVAAVIVLILLCTLYVKNAYAEDWAATYQDEVVEYVWAYGKPMAEHTKYRCNEGKLSKGRWRVRDYLGNSVKCEVKSMTRKEYAVFNGI